MTRAADRLLARIDERERNSQVSCGGEVGRVASDCPGERIPTVELAPLPAGIDLRTTPERAVDKYWGKYLLEIAKLQRAVDGIAVKESK